MHSGSEILCLERRKKESKKEKRREGGNKIEKDGMKQGPAAEMGKERMEEENKKLKMSVPAYMQTSPHFRVFRGVALANN